MIVSIRVAFELVKFLNIEYKIIAFRFLIPLKRDKYFGIFDILYN